MLEFLRKIKSTRDRTVKYILRTEGGQIVEFAYINKEDGKDIVCIPSQTLCAMGCKFCHVTDFIGQIPCKNLTPEEMFEGVQYVHKDNNLGERVLLVSYMGCGEPVVNQENVVASMRMLTALQTPLVRFAVATSLPRGCWLWFFEMTKSIAKYELPVKLHLSLHYTIDQIRREWMPKSLDIIPSLAAVDFYRKFTGNAVEIHYALIDGVNDTEQDAILLGEFLKGRDFNVKFLFYNEKPTLEAKASPKDRISRFRKVFDRLGIEHEYYIPPGLDIGASCGQFLMDYYVEAGEAQ